MLDKKYFWDGVLQNGETRLFADNVSRFLNKEKITENDEGILRDYRAWYEKNFSRDEIKTIQKALRVQDDGIVGYNTLKAIFSYELHMWMRLDGLVTRKMLQDFATNFWKITQKSSVKISYLNEEMNSNSPFRLNNKILNESYLRKQINENFVKNISSPSPSELVKILRDENFKKTQWNAYIYAVQSGLSMLWYAENMKFIDGVFGVNTRADLMEFQKSYKEKWQISEKNFGKLDTKSMEMLGNVLASL